MKHRYTLEKYKGPSSRYTCPQCGHKREFTRYIDTEANTHLGHNVGICNRAGNCGYHYTPRQYFADHPGRKEPYTQEKILHYPNSTNAKMKGEQTKTNLPSFLVEKSLTAHDDNKFVIFLHMIFAPDVVARLIAEYKIGSCQSATYWVGSRNQRADSTVFWFINKAQEVRYGQVKLFDGKGHTAKYFLKYKYHSPHSCTTGIHYLIKKGHEQARRELPQWLADYERQGTKMDCFFGEHLMGIPDYAGRPVAIVEAPKTAIIASVFIPHFTWLAVGSLSYLNAERCRVLKGKKVTLFPDLGACRQWHDKAQHIPDIEFTISLFLENKIPDQEKIKGMDIADYLLKPAA